MRTAKGKVKNFIEKSSFFLKICRKIFFFLIFFLATSRAKKRILLPILDTVLLFGGGEGT